MSYTPYTPEIRFADIDAMGHVNNATYLTYLEQARIHYFSQMELGTWDWKKHGVIVARHEIDYKRPIYSRDRVIIYLGCKNIGGKSLHMDYKVTVIDQEGQHTIAAIASTVLVCFDHSAQQTTSVPDQWREKMLALPSVTS